MSHLPRFSQTLQSIREKLSKNIGIRLQGVLEKFQKLKILLYLGLTCILGTFAHQSSSQNGVDAWFKNHPPSESFTVSILKTQGFIPNRNPRNQAASFRSLPALLDSKGTLWISENGENLIFFQKDLRSSEWIPTLYSQEASRERPESWLPLGSGWRALDALHSEINRKMNARPLSTAKISAKIPKKYPPRDFREIAY